MKKRRAFHLLADDPIIITASSASSDQGVALSFIPGAALWGALAVAAYFNCGNSWDMFHSGALKISNAYPVLSGAVAWPVPLSLHRRKGESARKLNAVCLASSEWGDHGQPKQFRDGYVNARSDALQKPRMQDAIKTAINPDTGAAFEAQIFASEAISAGQSFVFWLEGPESLLDLATAGLGERCFLGRSRSAEFGKATLSQINLPDCPQGELISEKTAYVWLLSDLCLSDEFGQPSLHPDQLGEPVTGQIDWTHSFLRFRTFWPFNAKWQSRALGRQVIEQGSVFRLENATAKSGFVWIGEENSSGCGLAYISDRSPLESLGALPEYSVETGAPLRGQDPSSLLNWLTAQAGMQSSRDAAMDKAAALSRQFLDMLAKAREHPSNNTDGPTKTQLNHLRNGVGKSGEESDAWMEKLWGSNEKAGKDPAWGFRVANRDGNGLIPLYQWMRQEVAIRRENPDELSAFIKALELAAKNLDDPEGAQ